MALTNLKPSQIPSLKSRKSFSSLQSTFSLDDTSPPPPLPLSVSNNEPTLRSRRSLGSLGFSNQSTASKLRPPSKTSTAGVPLVDNSAEKLTSISSGSRPPWNSSFHVLEPVPPLPPLNRTRTINPKYAPPPPLFLSNKKPASSTPSAEPKDFEIPVYSAFSSRSESPQPIPSAAYNTIASMGAMGTVGAVERSGAGGTSTVERTTGVERGVSRIKPPLNLPAWDDSTKPLPPPSKLNSSKRRESSPFTTTPTSANGGTGRSTSFLKKPTPVSKSEKTSRSSSLVSNEEQPYTANTSAPAVVVNKFSTVKPKVGSFDNINFRPAGGHVKIENSKIDLQKVKSKVGSFDKIKHQPGGGNVKIDNVKLELSGVKAKVGSFDKIKHQPGGGHVKIETVKLELENVQAKVGSLDNVHHQPGGGNVRVETIKLDLDNVKARVGSLDNIHHQPGGGNVKIETVKLDLENVVPRVGSFANIHHQPKGGNVKIETAKLDVSSIQAKVGSFDKSRPTSRAAGSSRRDDDASTSSSQGRRLRRRDSNPILSISGGGVSGGGVSQGGVYLSPLPPPLISPRSAGHVPRLMDVVDGGIVRGVSVDGAFARHGPTSSMDLKKQEMMRDVAEREEMLERQNGLRQALASYTTYLA